MAIEPYSDNYLHEIKNQLLNRLNQGSNLLKSEPLTDFNEFDENNPSHVQAWNMLRISEQMAIRLLVTLKSREPVTIPVLQPGETTEALQKRENKALDRLADTLDSPRDPV